MNCSGKHAAMLATCVANGWPTSTYRDPDHPLQVSLRGTVERLAGEPVAAVGVDGCGAPLFALTLTGLARAFAAIATAADGTPEHRVAAAIRRYPEWLGGTRRDVTRLVAGVPGLIAKDGAEGVYAAALPDGRAVALKIDDGGQRARPPVMVAALPGPGRRGAGARRAGRGAAARRRRAGRLGARRGPAARMSDLLSDDVVQLAGRRTPAGAAPGLRPVPAVPARARALVQRAACGTA